MAAEPEGHSANGAPTKEHPPASEPEPANPSLTGQSFAAPGQMVEPYDTSESAPPPGGGASPAPVPPQPPSIENRPAPHRSAEAADEEPELNFFDNAMISLSLAPDWAKFLAAAAVTAALALIGLGLLNGETSSDDVPDGFVPQTPELEEGAPAEPESDVTR